MAKPNFFIVGAPKCGTTSLYELMSQHGDIYFPVEKEPSYFAADMLPEGYLSDAAYLSLFDAVDSQTAIGEASSINLMSEVAAQRIHDFAPDAKIIIMLRCPPDQMFSQHGQMVFNGWEPLTDFEEALGAEPERLEGRLVPKSVLDKRFLFYRLNTRYVDQIQRYQKLFPKEQLFIGLLDDLRDDQTAMMRRVFDFLGVDRNVEVSSVQANPRKVSRSRFVNRLIGQNQALLDIGRRILPFEFRRRLLRWALEINMKPAPAERIDPVLRKALLKEYEPEIVRLEDLLGRDLSMWRRDL